MKKYFAIAFLFFSTLSFAQTGIGWGPIRYKVNFRDTINIDVAWMVHDTTILTSAKSINYLQGATSNVQTQISNKQDIPVNYAPTVITFGNATQNYDITGTTWVAATAGIPDAVGHLLPAALTSIATAYDGEYLAIREAAGVASATNPLTVQFTFPAVATFNVIKFRSIYVGSASHDMVFELYNGATWDIFTTNSIESMYIVHSAEVLVPATYIIGGTVLGRFRHEQTGNTGHHLDIDFIIIASGGGSGGAHAQSAIQTPSTATGNIAATNVQAAIEELENEKLAIADTATMLGHYIERTDTATMLLSYAKDTDVALKLNISDTASMLIPYINRADTATMLINYINRNDTATMLLSYAKDTDVALKLNEADTAVMLDSYAHTNNPTFYTGITTPAITLDGTLITATGDELNLTIGGDSNFQDQLYDTIPGVALEDSTVVDRGYTSKFDFNTGQALDVKLADSSSVAKANSYATGKMLADGLATKTNFGKLQFQVGVTLGAPINGDSIYTDVSFINKHLEVYRGAIGDSLYKQYRNPTGALQAGVRGYRFNKNTGELVFNPVLATNDYVAIEVSDSTAWTTLPLAYYSTLTDGNTIAWYKAESSYITTDGQDSVTVWADVLGSGHDLGVSSVTPNHKPIFQGDSVLFNGSTNFMSNYYTDSTTWTWAQPCFIYIVFTQLSSPVGWEDENIILNGARGSSTYMKQNSSTPKLAVYAGGTSTSMDGPAIDAKGIVRILFNGASSLFQVNEAAADADTDYGTTALDGFSLGNTTSSAPTVCGNFSVNEIILRSTADDATTQAILYNYLTGKWGL